VEISLDNLLHNLEQIRGAAGRAKVMAVVKDSAYGCGAEAVAGALCSRGVDFLAVATTAEARAHREAGIDSSVLVLGEAEGVEDLDWGYRNRIDFALNDLAAGRRWAALGVPVRLHCNIDTGMSRLGLLPSELPRFAEMLRECSRLSCTGVYTHFACADQPDPEPTEGQLRAFEACVRELSARGVQPPCVHVANSAALVRLPRLFTHVRPGIALYGCKPDPGGAYPLALEPVAALKGYVVRLRKVPAGTGVSYGWRYTTPSETHLATVGLGYAHGVPRFLSNKGFVLIGGRRRPIVGTVTMDYLMVDVGENPHCAAGDEVVAMGRQGDECITADEIALAGGTIGYEVLCHLGTHISRVYVLDGTVSAGREGRRR
jgi:alanine racemase